MTTEEWLQGVAEVDLRDNGLTDINGLRRQPALLRLYLGRNLISDLTALSHFSALRVLDLSDNKLSSVQLSGLASLQILNLAGNRLKSPQNLEGLSGCMGLLVVDLARNEIDNCDSFLEFLLALDVKGVSFLGNPGSVGSTPTRLAVYNGQVLPGKQAEAAELRALIPRKSGITWPASHSGLAAGVSSSTDGMETAAGPSRAAPSNMEGGGGGDPRCTFQQLVSEAQPKPSHDCRGQTREQEIFEHPLLGLPPTFHTNRRPVVPIMDSADDMSGGESSEGSVSGAAPLLPGLVQRQDSANYQPRPPALAERQDSAQNLQALAQAEADLIRAGSPIEIPAPLARQDSANELDDTRSSSPNRRLGHIPGGENADSALAAAAAVSPRHDSASERAGMFRPPAAQPPSQPRSIAGTAGEGMDRVLSGAPSMDRALGSASSLDGPSSSLEAARLLHLASRDESPPPRAGPSAFPATPLSPAERQDSALDSLAEARRAVLADLPQSNSEPIPSDPLRQARQLHSNLSWRSPTGPGKSRFDEGPGGINRLGSPRGTVLRVEDAVTAAQGSPFDMPVTPLSPGWTLSQLPAGHQQELPRIFSGVPWQPSSSSVERLSGGGSGIRDVLRRNVTGSAGPSRTSGDVLEASSALSIADEEPGTGAAEGQEPGLLLLPGRNGEVLRDTPYPDSPLAAGACGSRDNPAFFQHQASVRPQPDRAESSEAAARAS